MNVSDISKLHAPTIVDSLLELNGIDNSSISGKKAKKEPSSSFSLNIPCNYVTKEVKKLRACDLSNHLYCREWTILYLRKFFNFSTREVTSAHKATNNSITLEPPDDFLSNLLDIIQLRKNDFEASISRYSFSFLSYDDYLLDQIINTTHQKITSYNSPKNLDNFCKSLEISFENLDSTHEDYKDELSSKILEAVDSKEKGFFSLPRDNLDCLRYLSTSLQASLTFPVCDHSKESMLPDDIKELVDSATTRLRKRLSDCPKEWEIFSQEAWGLCMSFLDNISQFNLNRIETLKNSEPERSNNYHSKFYEETMDQYSEYWPRAAERFRKKQNGKKKQDPDDVMFTLNELFFDFIDLLETSNSDFISLIEVDIRFISSSAEKLVKILLHWLSLSSERLQRFDRIHTFTSISKMLKAEFLSSGFQHLLVLLSKNFNLIDVPTEERFKKLKEQILAKSVVARKIVEKRLDILKSQIEEFLLAFKKRFSECLVQQQQISACWLEQPSSTIANKLEKASSKDFRKQVKRLEQSFSGLRNWAVDRVNSLLTVIDVSDLITVCLEPLMLEAHLVHSVDFFTGFFTKYEPVIRERNKIAFLVDQSFAEGAFNGRKMLSVIIGNLFLKEGFRILELIRFDAKKQELLDDWDVASSPDPKSPKKATSPVITSDEPKTKKKNKKKKNKSDDSGSSTPQHPSSEIPSNHACEPLPPNIIDQPGSSSLLLSILNPIFKQDKDNASLSKNLKLIEPMLKSMENNIKLDLANHKKNPGSFPDNGLVSFGPNSFPKDYVSDFANFFNSTSSIEVRKSIKQLKVHYAKNMSTGSSKTSDIPEPKHKKLVQMSDTQTLTEGEKTENNRAAKSASSVWISGDKPVDLSSLPKEKLIVFIQSLLLDKNSLIDHFNKIEHRLCNVASQFNSFVDKAFQQDVAISKQSKEIQDYKQALLCQDSQLLLLVLKQNALRQTLTQFNELRSLLSKNAESSKNDSSGLSNSAQVFRDLDIDEIVTGSSHKNPETEQNHDKLNNISDRSAGHAIPPSTVPTKATKKGKRK